MLSVASWNCQGNPLDDTLSVGFLQRLLTDHDLVVLQSCGDLVGTSVEAVSDVTIGRIRCHIRGVRQAISVDPTCSVAILSRLGSAFPLEGGEALDHGQPGRFGVICTVPLGDRSLLVAALHDASGGMDDAAWRQVHPVLLSRAAPGGQPVLIAMQLGPDIDPGAEVALVDHRVIAHPSPGRRHDSFAALGLRRLPSPDPSVIDSGGASDHDAVCARFGL